MAHAKIEMQNLSIRLKTMPGSGVIQVLLSDTENCFYNPSTGRFATTPIINGVEAHLLTDHFEELKQKLNAFDADRKANIARLNQGWAMNSSTP